jgi:hypothetical protein
MPDTAQRAYWVHSSGTSFFIDLKKQGAIVKQTGAASVENSVTTAIAGEIER